MTSANAYTLHELQAPNGTVIWDYVSPAGPVYGVAWQGPALPDLRQVLGAYFDQYVQAMQKRGGHGPRLILVARGLQILPDSVGICGANLLVPLLSATSHGSLSFPAPVKFPRDDFSAEQGRYIENLFLIVLTCFLQGIAGRPLPCIYWVI